VKCVCGELVVKKLDGSPTSDRGTSREKEGVKIECKKTNSW
jgi:hypothetical protein